MKLQNLPVFFTGKRHYLSDKFVIGIAPDRNKHQAMVLDPKWIPFGKSFSFQSSYNGFNFKLIHFPGSSWLANQQTHHVEWEKPAQQALHIRNDFETAIGEVRPDLRERYMLLEIKSDRCQRTIINLKIYFLLDFQQVDQAHQR